jgi:hypothetical protein
MISVVAACALFAGCATTDYAVQTPGTEPSSEQAKRVDYAPSPREVLLDKALHYQGIRDYANALVNIIRAERIEGDEMLDGRISSCKNTLIENLNARALEADTAVQSGRGLDAPLEYMVFYTEGEIIYPAFNVPVTFEVLRGDASISAGDFTNSNGIARCDVNRINGLDRGELSIQACVYVRIDGEVFRIEKLEREFLLHHRSVKDEALSFVVFERNINTTSANSLSGKRIMQFFIEKQFSAMQCRTETDEELFLRARGGDASSIASYSDASEAGLVVFIHIASFPSSMVSEGFYFAKSAITLSAMDTVTGELVFESVIEGIKCAGNTELKAGACAISEATDRIIEQLQEHVSDLP